MVRFIKSFRKILSISLSVVMIASVLTGCGSANKAKTEKPLIGISLAC